VLERAIQALAPTLVLVTADRGGPDARGAGVGSPAAEALGSGFVVRADGVIATAYHLARAARRLTVRGIGWAAPLAASLVAKDEAADVALLRVLAHDLPAAKLHDRPADLGQEVLFLGFPHADIFDPPLALATRGMVGNRYALGGADRLVVDAVCSEGCSGGPLALAASGAVVGVVGARFDPARTRAKLRGAGEDELARLPREPTAITFAVEVRYLAALLEAVR
jgi:serine protease Do